MGNKITMKEVLERSKALGVMDIRLEIENPSLEDYWKALDSIEESQSKITPELLERARESSADGIKY